MSALSNAIRSGGLSGTAAEVLASLDATVTVRPSITNWSYKGLAIKFGREAVGAIDETLKSIPGLDWVRLSLASNDGLDFAAEETQAGLISLRDAGAFSKEVADGLIALGVETKRRHVALGFGVLPTIGAVQAALDEIATEDAASVAAVAKAQLRVWLRQKCDEIDLQIIADQIANQAGVVAAWGE